LLKQHQASAGAWYFKKGFSMGLIKKIIKGVQKSSENVAKPSSSKRDRARRKGKARYSRRVE